MRETCRPSSVIDNVVHACRHKMFGPFVWDVIQVVKQIRSNDASCTVPPSFRGWRDVVVLCVPQTIRYAIRWLSQRNSCGRRFRPWCSVSVQKRLNGSRFCSGWRRLNSRHIVFVLDGVSDTPTARGRGVRYFVHCVYSIGTFVAACTKLLITH